MLGKGGDGIISCAHSRVGIDSVFFQLSCHALALLPTPHTDAHALDACLLTSVNAPHLIGYPRVRVDEPPNPVGSRLSWFALAGMGVVLWGVAPPLT